MEKTKGKNVVVIGAGPAGLAAADYALEQGHCVTLLEKNDIAGGKGSSRQWGDFVVDNGPHAYHAMTKEITDFMYRHGGAEFMPVPILQKLYVTEQPMRYPLDIKEALAKFSLSLKFRIALDFIVARLKVLMLRQPQNSFKTWGVAHYGRTLYNICFGDYSERIWQIDADRLSVEFAKRKLPDLSAAGILWELLTGRRKKKGGDKSYLDVKQFLYHGHGIGKVYAHVADSIRQRGGKVLYNIRIKAIHLTEQKIVESVELSGPAAQTIPCDLLISTAPLTELTHYLQSGEGRLSELAKTMPFKHGVIVNVILRRPKFSDANWIYLVNHRFHFNRLSEPKVLSSHLAPADKTLIMLETICGQDDPRWTWTVDQWKPNVMSDLRFFGIQDSEVEAISLTKLEKAYPFYLVGYEEGKKDFLKELAHIPNLVSTGRYGLYLDIDMHDAMVLGKSALDYGLQSRCGEFYENHEQICLHKRDQ